MTKKRNIIESDDEDHEPHTKKEKHNYRSIINKMNVSNDIKTRLLADVDDFEQFGDSSDEKHKQRRFIENVTKIPFGKYSSKTVGKDDSFEKKREFLGKIKHNMDNFIFGQETAKNTITEVIAKKINNPSGFGNVIALCGPPGVGKTSLIKEGLAKSYEVPFNFISLGGARHTSFLKGSDISFIGSRWGKIVDILIKSNCMDPIIFMDELDKISISDEGMDVINCLVHLTDPSQNMEWEDNYFSGIPIDLSRATIIFSMNDPKLIPEPLLDRISVVDMKGFNLREKMIIGRKFCIPRLCKDVGFNEKNIIIGDDTLRTIIEKYSHESGVRKLEQLLKTILMKFNFFDMVELGSEEYKQFGPYIIDTYTAQLILGVKEEKDLKDEQSS